MVIINPRDDSVLTLKPEMKMKEYKNYTLITWPGVVYDPDEIAKNTTFMIDLNYDKMVKKLNDKDTFVVSQWKEV